MVTLPDDEVRNTCAAYLESADRHAPGLVEGLYLQGSVALGDYRPGVSDIDFVAVTGRAPDPETLRAIHRDLRRSHAKPSFDGLYVGWDDLRRDPAQVPAGPAVHEWRVDPASDAERHIVTWHVLAQAGVAVRGPATADRLGSSTVPPVGPRSSSRVAVTTAARPGRLSCRRDDRLGAASMR